MKNSEETKAYIMKYTTLIVLIITHLHLSAQSSSHSVFHLGHSLVNPYMPAMLQSVCDDDSALTHDYEIGIINGAPLFWTWDNSGDCQGYQASTIDAKTVLLSGDYDVFVMTEGVPWDPILADFYNYADSFYSLALQGLPTSQTYLYETWNCINTGLPAGCDYDDGDTILWATRVQQDFDTWREVADSLSTLHPTASPVYIIPAGQCLVRLKDSVDAGVVPSMTNFYTEIFTDDIHLTDTGNYFVALVHYATIYQKSPVGRTNMTIDEWGNSFNAPSPATALKMQEIIWETLLDIPESGVTDTAALQIQKPSNKYHIKFALTPNPAQHTINIQCEESIQQLQIIDLMGKTVLKKEGIKSTPIVDIRQLPNAMYIVQIITQDGIGSKPFIKK